jgi:general secretion pathway protein N
LKGVRFSLAVFCLLMFGIIGLELAPDRPTSTAATPTSPAPRRSALAVPSFAMPPSSAFDEILARPLFSPTRRPGTQVGRLPASSSFTLVAIVISSRDRHALLGSGQPLKIVRVAEGDEIGGWTVEAILPNAVVVRHADLREEVKPKDLGKAVAANPVSSASVMAGGDKTSAPHHPAHDE